MLVTLKKISRARYGSILAKEVDCTYSHSVKILQTLKKMGLVTFEKQGRIKLIKLTKKGLEIADVTFKGYTIGPVSEPARVAVGWAGSTRRNRTERTGH